LPRGVEGEVEGIEFLNVFLGVELILVDSEEDKGEDWVYCYDSY